MEDPLCALWWTERQTFPADFLLDQPQGSRSYEYIRDALG